jgi:hypothetical protein
MRITAQQTEWMIGGDQSPSGEIDWDGGNLNLSPFKGAVSGWCAHLLSSNSSYDFASSQLPFHAQGEFSGQRCSLPEGCRCHPP